MIALVGDVAAVLRDRGADPGFDQFLDLVDDVGVGRVFVEVAGSSATWIPAARARREQRRAADEMVEQGLEHERLEVGPRHAGAAVTEMKSRP